MDEKDSDPEVLRPVGKSKRERGFVVSSVYRQWTSRSYVWQPPTDVYETASAIIVRVEIAGMQNSEFTISLEEKVLIVQGVRSVVEEECAYHQMEIHTGEFVSLVELPPQIQIDDDGVHAEYVDGFLRVILPKARPTRIEVKGDG